MLAFRAGKGKVAPPPPGHDFFFVKETGEGEGEGGVTALGIADGVGGWEDSGVDPSHFSQAFMYYCSRAEGASGPAEIMERGFEGVTKEEGVLAGELGACCVSDGGGADFLGID